MTDVPDHIVIRPAAGLPDGIVPSDWDGRWFDRASFPEVPAKDLDGSGLCGAVPAGRFEVREDGAVAEVWEVRPR